MFVGIDIGKYRHQAAFLDNHGKDLCPSVPFDNSDEGFTLFFRTMDSVSDGTVIIGMEATGHYWLNLYCALLTRDIETHVINPIQTDAVRRMNIRKTKTDSVDCRYVAQVIRMGDYSDVAVQDSAIAELRQLCRYRYGLVDSVSSLKNQITGILDRIFPEYSNLFSDIFGVTSIELLKRYTTPDAISKVPTKRLTELLAKYSRQAFGEAKAIKIKDACAHSVGIGCQNPAFIFQLRQQIQLIEFTHAQIVLLEERIEECYSKFPCFLHTIKGIGVTSAAVILSEIGNISNFDSPKKLVAFAGIDPSVHQSGNFTASASQMSKRGSPYLRRALWNAAEGASRSNPVLADFYTRKRNEGKDHMTAVGATARKLCYIVFAILRDQRPFDANFSIDLP
jgi:transposase